MEIEIADCHSVLAQEAGMYHYTECGLPNIWLANGYRAIETPFWKAAQIAHVDSLRRAISPSLARSKPHLTGSEFRFLRTELDLSQARLASYFRI
jgi:DNA-binding transcriptional regulator YiaG